MQNKAVINNFPKYILNAPKIKFKKPTITPTPFILTESSYSSEHSDCDTEEDFSRNEKINEKACTENIKSVSLLIKFNDAAQE